MIWGTERPLVVLDCTWNILKQENIQLLLVEAEEAKRIFHTKNVLFASSHSGLTFLTGRLR